MDTSWTLSRSTPYLISEEEKSTFLDDALLRWLGEEMKIVLFSIFTTLLLFGCATAPMVDENVAKKRISKPPKEGYGRLFVYRPATFLGTGAGIICYFGIKPFKGNISRNELYLKVTDRSHHCVEANMEMKWGGQNASFRPVSYDIKKFARKIHDYDMIDSDQPEIPRGGYMVFDLPVGEYLVTMNDDGGAEVMRKLNEGSRQVADAIEEVHDNLDRSIKLREELSKRAAIGYGPSKMMLK